MGVNQRLREGDVGKAKTSKEVDCLLAGRPAFVDTSSYVAS